MVSLMNLLVLKVNSSPRDEGSDCVRDKVTGVLCYVLSRGGVGWWQHLS